MPKAKDKTAYQRHRKRMQQREAARVAAGQEIGPAPQVQRPRIRARARKSLQLFCERYFGEVFHLDWSPDHLKVIQRIETAVKRGGLFAMAMPRGSGKTTLVVVGVIWALITGQRHFLVVIGSDEGHAVSMLSNIKMQLQTNSELLADWPEVVYPIRCLEGSARRAEGQRCGGRKTHIVWREKELVLPTVRRSKASAGICRVTGLTGHFRGMSFTAPDGRVIRPDLVIIDDPQTDVSAASPTQCDGRERILQGAVLGLAGPGKTIAGFMAGTIIRQGDLVDRLLDHQRHPEWGGHKTKLVYSFPSNVKLWDEYGRIRALELQEGGDGSQATEFYRQNQTEMDAGARVAWPARFRPGELSAIQHAQNLRLDAGELAFAAEYQNEPLEEASGVEILSADQIAAKLNGLQRNEVPRDVQHLTAFVDVHDRLLYWLVCAWEANFTGYVIDYGCWPDQGRIGFSMRQAQVTLSRKYRGRGKDGALFAGLEDLAGELLGRQWQRNDGATMQLDRLLIDAGYAPQIVYGVCRRLQSAVVMPAKGIGIGAKRKPMAELRRRAGEKFGLHWRLPSIRGTRELRHVLVDVNYWKSAGHQRLAVPLGEKGCMSLWQSTRHRWFADQLTAERPVRVTGPDRTVDEWELRPGAPDNHYLDCFVGCCVAASMLGVTLPGTEATPVSNIRRGQPMRISELRRQRQGVV